MAEQKTEQKKIESETKAKKEFIPTMPDFNLVMYSGLEGNQKPTRVVGLRLNEKKSGYSGVVKETIPKGVIVWLFKVEPKDERRDTA